MAQIDSTSRRVLSLLRDRPLSRHEIIPLLDVAPDEASELLNNLLKHGLVSRLAGALRPRIFAAGSKEPHIADDEPLTLTFRGMLNL
jgi:DNA-binding IclR family transcriptional regulator